MTVTGTKDLVKREKPRYISPFEEMERWFENAWTRPFSRNWLNMGQFHLQLISMMRGMNWY
jgi:hypothetical protein